MFSTEVFFLLFARMNSKGYLSVPKKWRDFLDIKIGSMVSIDHTSDSIILSTVYDSQLNTRVLNTNGQLLIPAEIRRLMHLHSFTKFSVSYDKEDINRIVLTIHRQ